MTKLISGTRESTGPPMVKSSRLTAYIALAYLLWLLTFRLEVGSFWARMGLSVAVLLAVSLNERRGFLIDGWSGRPWLVLVGVVAGLAFYLLLYGGFLMFRPFVEDGAREVYVLRSQMPSSMIAPLLLFTSVGEEVYWRGFVQSEFSSRFGAVKALLSTAGLYAMVHVWTLNLPLILIALLAGLIWGGLYIKTGSLQSPIASHMVWTEMVFVFFPLSG
jgi:membrane protease YdiL (CAAX protease family)